MDREESDQPQDSLPPFTDHWITFSAAEQQGENKQNTLCNPAAWTLHTWEEGIRNIKNSTRLEFNFQL